MWPYSVKWLDAVKVVLIRLEPTGEKGKPGQKVHQGVTSSSWSMGTVSGSTYNTWGHSLITPRYNRGQREGVHWHWA